MTLTQQAAKVQIWPADHTGSNNRIIRRGFQAALAPLAADAPADVETWCPHSHKSIDAAKECGVRMWKELPK